MSINPNDLGDVFDPITRADERAAKAALGIKSDASVRAMDVSKLALFVTAKDTGTGHVEIVANATIHKREASRILRQVADMWDQEWKTAERAEQKKRRNGERAQS